MSKGVTSSHPPNPINFFFHFYHNLDLHLSFYRIPYSSIHFEMLNKDRVIVLTTTDCHYCQHDVSVDAAQLTFRHRASCI